MIFVIVNALKISRGFDHGVRKFADVSSPFFINIFVCFTDRMAFKKNV